MKYTEDKIPFVVTDSELGKATLNEVEYKKKILTELRYLLDNINLDSGSIYLLRLFLVFFRIPQQTSGDIVFIQNQLKAVLQAFQEIGTAESFIELFRIFLRVEIDVEPINNKAGSLLLKMRGFPQYNLYQIVVDPTKAYGFLVPREDKSLGKLAIGVSENDFVNNFYLFIQSIKGAGIDFEIQEPDGTVTF